MSILGCGAVSQLAFGVRTHPECAAQAGTDQQGKQSAVKRFLSTSPACYVLSRCPQAKLIAQARFGGRATGSKGTWRRQRVYDKDACRKTTQYDPPRRSSTQA